MCALVDVGPGGFWGPESRSSITAHQHDGSTFREDRGVGVSSSGSTTVFQILSSNDGLSHGESKTLETEEVLQTKRAQSSGGKTLFDQCVCLVINLELPTTQAPIAKGETTRSLRRQHKAHLFAAASERDRVYVSLIFAVSGDRRRRVFCRRGEATTAGNRGSRAPRASSCCCRPTLGEQELDAFAAARARFDATAPPQQKPAPSKERRGDHAPAVKLRPKPAKRPRVEPAPAPAALVSLVGCYDDDED